MIIEDLTQLIPATHRAVIINHNTKAVSFLALLSVLRYAQMPVLLIDCASTDGSMEFFSSKMEEYVFDLFKAPLRKHGYTLDRLFQQINDDMVLLVDSDAELLNGEIIHFLNRHIDSSRVFAAGFLNGPGWLDGNIFRGTRYDHAFYAERPFMPLVLWKVQPVKEALQKGYSFADRMINNEFAQLPRLPAKILRRVFSLFRIQSPWYFRKRYFLAYPCAVFYDTGAMLYEYLRYNKFLFFVNLPEPCHEQYITHFWGVTRSRINHNDIHTGAHVQNNRIEEVVKQRLQDAYGENL